MPEVDLQGLLKPIREDSPCGDDLSYDGKFLELLREAETTPDDVDADGRVLRPGHVPNWREVYDGCIELLARGRHLRLGVVLTLTLVKLDGYPGLAQGLSYVRALLEQWDQVYPRLDPDLDNDPMERVAILSALTTPRGTFGDPYKVLDRVFEAPLTDSRQFGKLSLKDFAVAAGTEQYPPESGKTPIAQGIIEAAFDETETATLEATAAALDKAMAELKAIEAILAEKAASASFSGEPLRRMISDATAHVKRNLAKRGSPAGAPVVEGGDQGPSGPSNAAAAAAASGEITSSEGVRLALQRVLRYYAKNEVSSPVPYVVRAAERLVGKTYREIYEILTPDAVQLFDKIAPEEKPEE
jgi:type VI secretion system protein ImpA